MAKDYATLPVTEMRRSDRAVEDTEWMKTFLHQAPIGILSTVHDGQPFINTNLFVYDEDEHCVYMHTARVGRTRANVEHYDKVCFAIMEMGRLLPAPEALEFSVEYAGIHIFGSASIVNDQEKETIALQMLMDKYAQHLQPGVDYRPPVPEELKRTTVYRIDIEEWSGKKKEVEADFPGAYWYPEQPVLTSVQEHTKSFWQGQVKAIQIAPEAGAELQQVAEVCAVAGRGLEGDRYFDRQGTFSNNGKDGRDITLVAQEDIQSLMRDHDIEIDPRTTRRNIVTQNVPLNYLVGKKFQLGEAVLVGTKLCEPCDYLAKHTGLGKKLLTSMVHRGGLRANIIKSGLIRAGDVIREITDVQA